APNPAMVEIIVALASFAAAYAFYRGLFPDRSMSGRVRSHLKRRQEDLSGQVRAARRQKSVGMVRSVLEYLKLTRGEEVRKSTELLIQAGWRAPDALTIFLGLRLGLPLALGIAAFLIAP